MTILPFNFTNAVAALAHPAPLTVRDTGGGAYVKGRWTAEPESIRRMQAIVLQMRPEELQILEEGNISGGGIILHTGAELYFADAAGQGNTVQSRQSYVEYQGYTFKIIGTGFMMGNANFNTYRAVRYDAR